MTKRQDTSVMCGVRQENIDAKDSVEDLFYGSDSITSSILQFFTAMT